MYVTDCLRILIGSNVRYVDLISTDNNEESTESAESIIKRISEGLDRIGGGNSGSAEAEGYTGN